MNNITMVSKAKKFARELCAERYVQGDKRKMGKPLFKGDVESSWIAGLLTVVDDIHKQHAKQPYETPEVLLGDLQIWAEETFNYFNTHHGGGKLKRVKVDDFIRKDGLVIE